MNPLRRLLLILTLAVTLVVTNSYAQPTHEECGCCTEAQQMLCAACKVCTTPGLVAALPAFMTELRHDSIATVAILVPSLHTEDIWHPPRRAS